jgi:Uma2 family endonuclease
MRTTISPWEHYGMATTIQQLATTRESTRAISHGVRITLRLRPVIDLTSDQLLELSSLNDDLQLEKSAHGELIIMAPAGSDTSDRNAEITFQLRGWAKRDGTGISYDSSGGFILPDGAILAPDAAWVLKSRLEALTAAQREKYLPLCPDFVIELRSPSDRLPAVQRKMRQYLANGARLGWLIDPSTQNVEIYRPNSPVERLDRPDMVSADPVLSGFTFDFRELWPEP